MLSVLQVSFTLFLFRHKGIKESNRLIILPEFTSFLKVILTFLPVFFHGCKYHILIS